MQPKKIENVLHKHGQEYYKVNLCNSVTQQHEDTTMAMYHYRLNTFKDVARHYDSIKPIRGSDNIRPLGDRARKWEHIHKVSDNKYVLLDSLPADALDPIWREPLDELIKRAPVTWTRSPSTGIEKIRIRNGSGQWSHNSRYSFLERALPYTMGFVVNSGKQYVRYDNERHYLPKTNWVHRAYYDEWAKNKTQWHSVNAFTKHDDGKYLEFKRVNTDPHPITGLKTIEFELVHGDHKHPVTRYRIDKKAKAPYQQACKDFVEWAWVMRPLLIDSIQQDWETRQRIQRDIGTACSDGDGAEFRKMLLDEDDERRTAVVCWIFQHMASYDWQTSTTSITDDPKAFRRQFLNHVNQYAKFRKEYKEYKEG